MNLPITDNGVRPAGKNDECFYCRSPVGQHTDECVCVERSVVIKATIEYVVKVPRSWDVDLIEFQRNESSWCADNDLEDLAALVAGDRCACSSMSFKFEREATEDDHESLLDLSKPAEQSAL